MPDGDQQGRAPARRSRQEDRIMVRHTVRRGAVLAAAGALAVLAGAGPALAAGPAPAPAPQAVAQAAAGAPAPGILWCPPYHHHGLVTGLLDGVVYLVDALL
jgi:hypothetical protein